MKNPKVSIITVSLNSEATIRRTIESVINQTYNNIEYIIIDGGSTDGTLSIISEYSDRIDYFVSEKDSGIYEAFNKGIKASNGDIIGIINSDDWYSFEAVEQSVNEIEKSDAEFCCSNAIMIEDEMILGINKSNLRINPWYGCRIIHPSVFVKKELYDEIGLFDEKYSIASDYKWMLEVMVNNRRLHYFDKETVYFRRGGVSTTLRFKTAYETYCAIKGLLYRYNVKLIDNGTILEFWKRKVERIRGDELIREEPWRIHSALKELGRGNPVVIWGAGNFGRKIIEAASTGEVDIPFVIDLDYSKANSSLMGKKIYRPETVAFSNYDVLMAIDLDEGDLIKSASVYGIPSERLFTLHDVRRVLCKDLFED